MVKIVAMGDPHGNINKIKKIPLRNSDFILITGDFGKADFARKRFFENVVRKDKGLEELEYTAKDNKKAYMEIFGSTIDILKYTSKFASTYSILGNVGMDMVYDSNVRKQEKKYGLKLPSLRQNMNKIKDFYFVRNVVRNLGGLRVGFLEYFVDVCWFEEFGVRDKKKIKKAKKETAKAKKILKNFKNLDILVCHQPPFGYLDKVSGKYGAPKNYIGKHAGSKVILDYIKKYEPRYVFCGHIHEGEGKVKMGQSEIYNLGVAGHKIVNFK
ncbi:MAG TPA: metallophosphoesterase [Candidatus Nanoarchaeia archaeon]|nr:metallophosphoesterase [Candidatus Nanoarchaeia archaeon]